MSFKKTFKKIAKVVNPITYVTSNPFSAAKSVKGIGNFFGGGGMNVPGGDPNSMEGLYALAEEEQRKRQELGRQQQAQIGEFATDFEKKAMDYRGNLAKSLAQTSQDTFKRANPYVLEDLNSRGLFTSQTARDEEQGRLLQDLAREESQQLSAFDTDIFNQLSDIRGQGLSALLGGDQSALDSALGLRKAGLQRRFDEADIAKEQAFSSQLAKRQSRDQLLSSLLGLGGRLATRT